DIGAEVVHRGAGRGFDAHRAGLEPRVVSESDQGVIQIQPQRRADRLEAQSAAAGRGDRSAGEPGHDAIEFANYFGPEAGAGVYQLAEVEVLVSWTRIARDDPGRLAGGDVDVDLRTDIC